MKSLIANASARPVACAFAALASFWTITAARGELPPYAYREMQNEAPEALTIKVTTVRTKSKWGFHSKDTTYNVEAVIEKVERTATGLKPGAVIEIAYTQRRHHQPIPGPSEVPSLKKGKVCPAYLEREKNGTGYLPTAGGYSFETVD